MKIKDRIKYLRKIRDWSIVTLASKAGIAHSTISQIEIGKCKPSADVLIKLSRAFEVSTDYLLGIQDESSSMLKINDKKLLEEFRQIDQFRPRAYSSE